MSSFDKRLENAIQRGQSRRVERQATEIDRKMSAEQLKNLHSQYRLQLSEQIEQCMKRLPDHFPGFRLETVYGDKGWGAACSRDDLKARSNTGRESFYSRLMLAIRPHSNLNVLELVGKATVRNRELFNRNYFEELEQANPEHFANRIDHWVIEFAEQYAA